MVFYPFRGQLCLSGCQRLNLLAWGEGEQPEVWLMDRESVREEERRRHEGEYFHFIVASLTFILFGLVLFCGYIDVVGVSVLCVVRKKKER